MAKIIPVTLLFLALVSSSMATNHDITWSAGTDYSNWASGKSVSLGDTITFLYGGFHTVEEVSQADYEACTSSSSLSSHGDGNTVITMDKEGTRYFICGAAGHCQNGMKIAITVSAAAAAPPLAGDTPVETPLTPPSSSGRNGGAAVSPPVKNMLVAGFVLAGLAALV